jgi:hypothetical protein
MSGVRIDAREIVMTTSQPQYSYPAAAAVSGWLADDEGAQTDAGAQTDEGVPVGAGDAEADRARAGDPDADLSAVPRESDGVPIGRADAEADARRTGADPDAI